MLSCNAETKGMKGVTHTGDNTLKRTSYKS